MDPQGAAAMMSDGGVYNFAEIWQGFQMDGSTTSSPSYNVGGLDPMVMDQKSNHGSPNYRKRRDEDEQCGKGVVSISNSNGSNNIHNNGVDGKRLKGVGLNGRQENNVVGEVNSGKEAGHPSKKEPPKQDFIHVRARRGQATDSHSLAERARREKISERTKILQDLVPGCNKASLSPFGELDLNDSRRGVATCEVIGKALVLDEIINYIQSLQRQVEFLSMKLEAVNARGNIDLFHSKDFAQHTFEAPGMPFGSQGTREYGRGSSPEWLHMQIGGGFDRTS